MSTRLIIDTDPALGIHRDGRPRDVDDGLAIVEAINDAQIDLLGITITYGNGTLEDGVAVANDLVRLKGADVKVYAGAAQPLTKSRDITPAVQYLAETLEDQKCSVAAIGPLTNLGLLLEHAPQCAQNIEQVVIVGGRTRDNAFFIGGDGPVNDFNVENDMSAARILLESGVPVVMAGFELSVQIAVTAQDLSTIAERGTDTARYLHDRSQDWLQWWTGQFKQDSGYHPWDSAAIAWFLNPELYTTEQRGWRIKQHDARTQWLETHADFPGDQVTFCTGFVEGGKDQFVANMMSRLH